ncbi:MAG: ABC transporter permease, partial [Gemmataceae bacterium]
AALTKAKGDGGQATVNEFVDREGSGLLRRGAALYQTLVPMYTVLFAFFLVLIVGWVFVGERRQGTLKRLRLAPLTRGQILLGKLLPCFAVSVGQGFLLLILGKLVFGMRWGPDDWPWWHQVAWLSAVVLCTSFAAMGLAMLVASVARTETQVQLFGGVPVLVLGVIGGCVLPRAMMPEGAQVVTLFTPHGWALNAYNELLAGTPGYAPNLPMIVQGCGMLILFGAGFLAAAWWLLSLD